VVHDPAYLHRDRNWKISDPDEHVPSYSGATKFLAEGSTDLIVIDWEGEPSLDCGIRSANFKVAEKNRPSLPSPQWTAQAGVHVILRKP